MNQKRKVAILLHGLGANGIDTLFANLAEQWNQKDFDITYFLAVDSNAHQFWEERVAIAGIRIVKLHDLDKGRLKRFPLTIYHAFKRYGPFDAIHVNMDMLSGMCAMVAVISGIKTRVIHAHSSGSDMPHNPIKCALKRIYIAAMKSMIRMFSTRRVACSDVAGDYFFGKGKYQLVYNGINIDNYYVDRSERKRGASFVAVGRLFTPKNPIKIVEVFSEIHRRIPKATLIWLGDGQMRSEIETLIQKFNLGGG